MGAFLAVKIDNYQLTYVFTITNQSNITKHRGRPKYLLLDFANRSLDAMGKILFFPITLMESVTGG
jgi:hypothetical protein